jgi:hypothetical protein
LISLCIGDQVADPAALWYTHEHIYTEYLGRPQHTKPLVDAFSRNLGQALERYPVGEWAMVNVEEFCPREVAAKQKWLDAAEAGFDGDLALGRVLPGSSSGG